ncbi:MAG: UvrD-helicase domain-containing protein [Verrucomicrobia bacterium]|nr:UvrD-helicase domain-containing protein [Verrucomicrobiota bacterium]
MSAIGHKAISASAGSGKTYQLATRYIRLMAEGAEPDRIAAMTFSRKAAGEIFDAVVNRLAEACLGADKAKQLAEGIGQPEWKQSDFLPLLRRFLSMVQRLHISTLDSFIVGIARAFPTELGIPMDFDVTDSESPESLEMRQDALDLLFRPGGKDKTASMDFFQAFKEATFGREEKLMEENLNTYLKSFRTYYQLQPDGTHWGNKDAIWEKPSFWLEKTSDVSDAADISRRALDRIGALGAGRKAFEDVIEMAELHDMNSPWSDIANKTVFKKLLDEAQGEGDLEITYSRKTYTFNEKEREAWVTLLRRVIGAEIRVALRQTAGIFSVLDIFENCYDQTLRRTGLLSFDDAQYLLTPESGHTGTTLSRNVGSADRLYIDYRLDCELDHWLLDEFQDTSDLQWSVLKNLADEIIQDVEGRRSFFYVGDVKQAIYSWRGGNPRLFGRILEEYPEKIEQEPLSKSFRSAQPIIDFVNKVFTDLPEEHLNAESIERWNTVWQEHSIAEGIVPDNGYAAVIEPAFTDDKPTAEDRYEVVAGILNENQPLSKGLSVAILVRTNKAGAELVDYLREECPGMRIAHEGSSPIMDSPVVTTLLSLVKFAAHPGDTFAANHVRMSPLGETPSSVELLREIQTHGFQEFIRKHGSGIAEDKFGQRRLSDLIEAASQFDQSGDRDCDSFVRFVENYTLQDTPEDDAVRVMTIHQSKGLGFDVVILPELQNDSMTSMKNKDFAVHRKEPDDPPDWLLRMPRTLVQESDEVLSAERKAMQEDTCFDNLCVLYVALTRAKRALYCISSFPGKSSYAFHQASLIKNQLTGETKPSTGDQVTIDRRDCYIVKEFGDRDCITSLNRKSKTEIRKSAELSTDFNTRSGSRTRYEPIAPSMQAEVEELGSALFSGRIETSLNFGTLIHELFERIEWLDTTDIEEAVKDWRQASSAADAETLAAVETEFRQAIQTEEFREHLTKKENVEVWRERSFEIILDNKWVTGTFDRVHIHRDADGKVVKAKILDYKSNAVLDAKALEELKEHYRPQMDLYRRVSASMLALDEGTIELSLLFTKAGKGVDG